jgi:metal-responsive CopG/Arc/MetJ family transcriptional regulator
MIKKRKLRARAPGMTQISISLPEGLVDKIDEMADAENRNRSNFIATVLEDLSRERGAKGVDRIKAA